MRRYFLTQLHSWSRATALALVVFSPQPSAAAETPQTPSAAFPSEEPVARVPATSSEPAQPQPSSVQPEAEHTAAPRVVEPPSDDASDENEAQVDEREEDAAPPRSYEDAPPPTFTEPSGEPTLQFPYFRFGVAAFGGVNVLLSNKFRVGIDTHFGMRFSREISVSGGGGFNLPFQDNTRRAPIMLVGHVEVEWNPTDWYAFALGPALSQRAGGLSPSEIAAGVYGRTGFLLGSRSEGKKENAFFLGAAFHAFFFSETFFSPVLLIGYERF